MQRSGTSTTSSTAERPTSPFFYLTLSGLDVVGGNPAFRVTESQLRALKQPSSDAVVSARLALIRELHTAPKGPIAGGSILHDAWMACLNKEGCALACYLFGGPPDSSRREAIDWLVQARCPVLTYDSGYLPMSVLIPPLAGHSTYELRSMGMLLTCTLLPSRRRSASTYALLLSAKELPLPL